MSASKNFRQAVGPIIIAAATTLTGCASVVTHTGENGLLPGQEVKVGGLFKGDTLTATPVFKDNLREKTTKIVNGAKGCETEVTKVEREVHVVGRTPISELGHAIGEAVSGVGVGIGAIYSGQGAKAYGMGVKNGQLKPGDYINNESTTLNQNPQLTSTQDQKNQQNPTLTANQDQKNDPSFNVQGGAGGGGGSSLVGVDVSAATGPIDINNKAVAQQAQEQTTKTGPVSATGGATGPINNSAGASAKNGPVSATGGKAVSGANAGAQANPVQQTTQGQQTGVVVQQPTTAKPRPTGPQ